MPTLKPTQTRIVDHYYPHLQSLLEDNPNELSTREPMKELLSYCCKQRGWKFVVEKPLPNNKIPDATIQAGELHFYWEAKDDKDNLKDEIDKKFKLGYPCHFNLTP